VSRGPRPRRRDDDAALRIGDVLEPHLETIVGQEQTGTVGPLDHGDPSGLEGFFPARVGEVDALETVEVDMKEGQTPAAVLAHDDECRARDLRCVDAEADGDAPRQHRLPRPELARESKDIVRARRAPQAFAEAFGVQR